MQWNECVDTYVTNRATVLLRNFSEIVHLHLDWRLYIEPKETVEQEVSLQVDPFRNKFFEIERKVERLKVELKNWNSEVRRVTVWNASEFRSNFLMKIDLGYLMEKKIKNK